MQESDKIQVYDNQPIRTAWDEQNEEWYFSIVDVVSVLTDQPDRRRAGKYWSVLKTRLKKEGSQLPTNCSQLKLKADDGKRYKTDVANTEQLLRIIQSIPSKKAEPFKLWLAQIGRERIEETIDPELTIDRALDTYSKKGYPADWINQRLQTIRARKELTDQWQTHGVEKGKEYAILTDEVTRAWSGMNTSIIHHASPLTTMSKLRLIMRFDMLVRGSMRFEYTVLPIKFWASRCNLYSPNTRGR